MIKFQLACFPIFVAHIFPRWEGFYIEPPQGHSHTEVGILEPLSQKTNITSVYILLSIVRMFTVFLRWLRKFPMPRDHGRRPGSLQIHVSNAYLSLYL